MQENTIMIIPKNARVSIPVFYSDITVLTYENRPKTTNSPIYKDKHTYQSFGNQRAKRHRNKTHTGYIRNQ